VAYYHVVFTPSAPIADIAYQNKAEIYAILFKGRRRDADRHRSGPQASRRPDRRHRGAPYLRLGAHHHAPSHPLGHTQPFSARMHFDGDM
jgi:hypothetical protein